MAEDFSIDEVTRFRRYLEKRLKGQSKAIDAVCRTYEYAITLRDLEQRKGPLGTFLFLGPSGVGKTEMARLMAAYFSGSENSLIKIPCVGFSQPHMIHSIIGAPHSYIGFDQNPVLSREYIDSKVIRKKTDVPVKKSMIDQLSYQSKKLLSVIRSLEAHLLDVKDRIETNMSLINFLGTYDKLLHGGGSEVGEKSLHELLGDRSIKEAIAALITKDSMSVIEQDIRDPLGNMALLIELYATTKGLVKMHELGYQELEKAAYHQGYLSEMIKTTKADESLAVAPQSIPGALPKIVILFDEIEKGNKTLHDLLLEITEDGKVTLANNKVTDLSDAFIVLTGNVGANLIGDTMKGRKIFGFSGSSSKNKLSGGKLEQDNLDDLEKKILNIAEKELEKTFSPEFRGRIDDIIVFRPLSLEGFRGIVDYQVELFQIALMSRDIELEVDDDVKKTVIEQSLHRPEVGARLLSHKLKSLVKIPLGRELAKRKNFKGRVRVLVKNLKISFEFN